MFKNGLTRRNLFFSERYAASSQGKKIAALAVFTALSVVTNMFLEIRILDIQFSLTIFFSAVTGVFLGPIAGFCTCVLGDFIGYVFNSWGQLYMPWVGVSTGLFALIAGLLLSKNGEESYSALCVKLAIYAVISFFVCTVLVNSVGFYVYNYTLGFGSAFKEYAANKFGGNSDFFVYLLYRLFFKGQIWNSVANYALLFAFFPLLKKIRRASAEKV